jgi:hypothetical protein
MSAHTPESTREIRARPLNVVKELPLLFTDEHDGTEDVAYSAAAGTSYYIHASLPHARLTSSKANDLASASAKAIREVVHASGDCRPFDDAGADVVSTILVPMFEVADWNTDGQQRRFRRPPQFIRYKGPSVNEMYLVEYEMDDEDEEWLKSLNVGQSLLDYDRFEEMMNALERASFRALYVPAGIEKRHEHRQDKSSGIAAAARTQERERPKRSGTEVKAAKPPPPTDSELLELPVGLCRRYQQGRCHKGRSCKWKHELWDVLQRKWKLWQVRRLAKLVM